jgi:hypothetical protein
LKEETSKDGRDPKKIKVGHDELNFTVKQIFAVVY